MQLLKPHEFLLWVPSVRQQPRRRLVRTEEERSERHVFVAGGQESAEALDPKWRRKPMRMPSDSNSTWIAHAEAHVLRYEVEVLVDRPPILRCILVRCKVWCEMRVFCVLCYLLGLFIHLFICSFSLVIHSLICRVVYAPWTQRAGAGARTAAPECVRCRRTSGGLECSALSKAEIVMSVHGPAALSPTYRGGNGAVHACCRAVGRDAAAGGGCFSGGLGAEVEATPAARVSETSHGEGQV